MSEYLITTNNVYIRLDEFYDSFAMEVELIDKAKCELANYGKLSDLTLSNGTAYVYEDGPDYRVYYNGLSFHLYITDNMISDYSIE